MEISSNKNICTIIVTLEGNVDSIQLAKDHASSGLKKFAKFQGFIDGATHLSEDNTKLIQYLQWKTKVDHENCVNDPSWLEDESSINFMKMITSNNLKMSVAVYDVIASTAVR